MTNVIVRIGNFWTQREDNVKKRKETAINKPRTEASGKTSPADTLISDFQHPKLFKPLSVWSFVNPSKRIH